MQVMLRVTDLERSIKFYTEALGLTLIRTRDNPENKYKLAFLGKHFFACSCAACMPDLHSILMGCIGQLHAPLHALIALKFRMPHCHVHSAPGFDKHLAQTGTMELMALPYAGYGKEEETCVFELTYNYGQDKYDNFKGDGYGQVALSTEVCLVLDCVQQHILEKDGHAMHGKNCCVML